jgi:hypothetical protein
MPGLWRWGVNGAKMRGTGSGQGSIVSVAEGIWRQSEDDSRVF